MGLTLVSRNRNFGGRQWYFDCPVKERCDQPSARWKNADENAADCRRRSGRMGFVAKTKMDARLPLSCEHHHSQRKPLAKSRSEKRPALHPQSVGNLLSQWPTRAIAGANRRK